MSGKKLYWEKTFGGYYMPTATSVCPSYQGGYLVAGTAYSRSGSVLFVLKIDEDGNQLWRRSYKIVSRNEVCIQRAEDTGYIVAATTKTNVIIFKIDEDGNTLWEKTIGNSESFREVLSICSAYDGGYMLAGSNENGACIAKISVNGDLLWVKNIKSNAECKSICFAGDGGYVISGILSAGNTLRVFLSKVDNEGYILWEKLFLEDDKEYHKIFVSSISCAKEETYVVAFYANSLGDFGVSHDLHVLRVRRDGDIVWYKTFDVRGVLAVYSVCTADDGYLVVGYTQKQIYLMKIDENGNVVWQKTLGEATSEAYSACLANDRGFILVGDKFSKFGEDNAIYILKIDNDGTKVWDSSFKWNLGNQALSICPTGKDYIVCGFFITDKGKERAQVFKISEDGVIVWDKLIGEELTSGAANSICKAVNGYFVVGSLNSKPAVFKINEDGEINWIRIFDNVGSGIVYSICPANDDGYVVVGEVIVENNKVNGLFAQKINEEGETIWEVTPTKHGYRGISVCRGIMGGYVIAGEIDDSTACVLTISEEGQILWSKTYPGAGISMAHSIAPTGDGGFIIAGSTWIRKGKQKMYVFKIDKEGNLIWEKIFRGAANSAGFSVCRARDNGYIVAGIAWLFWLKNSKGYVVKIDEAGELIWDETFGRNERMGIVEPNTGKAFPLDEFGSENSVILRQVQLANKEGYIITGYSKLDKGVPRAYVIKINEHGIIPGY